MSNDNNNGDGTDGQAWGFVSEQPGGMSMGQAQQIQDEVLQITQSTDVSANINTAAQLLTSGRYQDAIQAYEQIKHQHPEQAALCESQIGAAWFFLGNYDTAIHHYNAAKSLGADAMMMDMNIQEAQEKLGAHRGAAAPGFAQPGQGFGNQPGQPGHGQGFGNQPGQPGHGQGFGNQPGQQQLQKSASSTPDLDGNDIAAMVLAVFIPGAGYFLVGQPAKAIAVIIGMIVTCGGLGFGWIFTVLDTFLCVMARKKRPLGTWEFFPDYQETLQLKK